MSTGRHTISCPYQRRPQLIRTHTTYIYTTTYTILDRTTSILRVVILAGGGSTASAVGVHGLTAGGTRLLRRRWRLGRWGLRLRRRWLWLWRAGRLRGRRLRAGRLRGRRLRAGRLGLRARRLRARAGRRRAVVEALVAAALHARQLLLAICTTDGHTRGNAMSRAR
jgi:hypothetical protein